jgi:hypothetical protein
MRSQLQRFNARDDQRTLGPGVQHLAGQAQSAVPLEIEDHLERRGGVLRRDRPVVRGPQVVDFAVDGVDPNHLVGRNQSPPGGPRKLEEERQVRVAEGVAVTAFGKLVRGVLPQRLEHRVARGVGRRVRNDQVFCNETVDEVGEVGLEPGAADRLGRLEREGSGEYRKPLE